MFTYKEILINKHVIFNANVAMVFCDVLTTLLLFTKYRNIDSLPL